MAFDDAYTFKYSVREGTPAVRLADHVDDAVAWERLDRLIGWYGRRRGDTTWRGRLDPRGAGGAPARRGDLMLARTRTNKVALVDGPDDWIGTYRRVRFTGTTGSTFTAWPVEQELALWA